MSILHTCSRFQRFQEKGKLLLPQIYIKSDDHIQQCSSYNGKFKVSLRKVMKIYGEGSGVVSELNTIIQDKKPR